MPLPKTGNSPERVLDEMRAAAAGDADWRAGKTWSLVYNAGEDVLAVSRRAYDTFFSSNALNPMAFPSLRRFETEVLGFTAGLLRAPPEAAGSMTSGGTESILMALKTARDWGRAHRPQAMRPEVVLPVSAHPAFDKAAHYLGLRAVYVPVGADYRVDLEAVADALSDQTLLVVGSAPSFPQGVIDDIPQLAKLAQERGLLCHVDACVGGFFLPFLEQIGEPVPPWDFRVPGVTSISADLHKYGYTARGASTITYRDRALRRHQFHVQTNWPGGLYGSPTMTGSRPGGPIASAWAVLNYLGDAGYQRLTRTAMEATRQLQAGVREAGLRILGEPVMSAFAFAADDFDVYALCDAMDASGWKIDRQQLPPSAHLVVSPGHLPFVTPFLAELRAAVEGLRSGASQPSGSAAMYGALARMPERAMVGEFVLGFMDSLDQVVIALGTCAFVAFACEALAGFGGTVLALALGAHARPLSELLAIFIPANLVLSGALALRHARAIEWRLLGRRIVPAMAAGLPLGLVLHRVAGRALVPAFAVVVIGLGVLGDDPRGLALDDNSGARGGTLLLWLAGVVHGAWGSGGPLVVFVTGRDVENANARRATLAVLWLGLNLVLLASLILDGRVDGRTLGQTLALLPIVALALFVGDWLAARLSDRPFRAFCAALLGAAGVLLILRGA